MTKGKYLKIFVILLILTCFAGWQGYHLYSENINYRETRFLFDTEVYVEAHGWGAKKAATEALNTMVEIDQKLNKFSSDSEIYAINTQAGERPVSISELTYEVIEQSLKIALMTKGAFDPAIGPLVKLWGFGEGGQQSVPATEDIHTALRLVNYQKVILDQEQRTVYLTEKGMSLDLGAIAKGYAVNKAVNILKRDNISSALVSAGGNIYALGKKDGDTPWHIGIRNPLDKEKVIGYVELENQAIDTSGDYERFFWAEGKKYSHILDPGTGYPAQGVSGCTVIMDNPTEADAFATAVFVLGAESGLELIEREDGFGLIITSEGKLVLSQGMKGKLKN